MLNFLEAIYNVLKKLATAKDKTIEVFTMWNILFFMYFLLKM